MKAIILVIATFSFVPSAVSQGCNVKNFRGRGKNLNGCDLPRVDFSQSNQTGANFQKSNLMNANFNHAILEETDFYGATLVYANFQGAKLNKAKLRDTHLSSANLEGADARGVDFEGSFLFSTYLNDAKLNGAKLKNVDARYVDLRRADLQSADLSGADLRGVRWEGANFERANLQGTQVSPDLAEYLKSQGFSGFIPTPWLSRGGVEFTPPKKCSWVVSPTYIKTKGCGGFCSGQVQCKQDEVEVLVSVACQSAGDDCPTADNCHKAKKPEKAFFVGTIADYKNKQYLQELQNQKGQEARSQKSPSEKSGATR